MPKAPAGSSSSPVKSEPYPPQSPTKSGKAGGGKGGAIFTDEIDRQIMNHVLSISDINLRYNWPDLAKSGLPQFTPKQASPRLISGFETYHSIPGTNHRLDLLSIQLKGRWDYKIKNALFPPEVMKMSKQAKEGGKAAKAEE
jgi:hypothetical protein